MVNTIWFQFDLIRFQKYFSCVHCKVMASSFATLQNKIKITHHGGPIQGPLKPLQPSQYSIALRGLRGLLVGPPLCLEAPVSRTAVTSGRCCFSSLSFFNSKRIEEFASTFKIIFKNVCFDLLSFILGFFIFYIFTYPFWVLWLIKPVYDVN